jgi:TolB protein
MRLRKREIVAKRPTYGDISSGERAATVELTIVGSHLNVPVHSDNLEEFIVSRTNAVSLRAAVCVFVLVIAALSSSPGQQSSVPNAGAVGLFEGHGDVGTVLHAGSVEYDAGKRSYTIAGSGENMWLGSDAFQFVWKKVSGDVTLTADISFIGKGVNEHRKAVLMVRQSLDADSPYADVAVHGSGLTSLQFREEKGTATREIQANVSAPRRVRIEKRGAYFTMSLAGEEGEFHLVGGSARIELKEPFYVGIGVCSHDKDVIEKAVFSNVELKLATPLPVKAE